MSSKGQGLSLNTIVIAAIVLIVLLILVGMTTGYFGSWKQKFGTLTDTSCTGQGGHDAARPCPSGEKETGATDLPAGRVCCVSEEGRKRCEELVSNGHKGGCFPKGTCGVDLNSGDWSCNGEDCCESSTPA